VIRKRRGALDYSKEFKCEEVCETACLVLVRDPPAPRSLVNTGIQFSMVGVYRKLLFHDWVATLEFPASDRNKLYCLY
jgi:hypothetical protein